jgi:spermidine synthase
VSTSRSQRRLLRLDTRSGWLEVWQSGRRRSLWFDDEILQSEIDLDDPGRLPNPVNRAMLAHLLFGQQPQRVLLAGCGGGGIARWFAARSGATAGVAVEIDPAVAVVAREHFEFPLMHQTWQLVEADINDYLRTAEGFDWMLVDIATAGFSPDWVSEPRFLRACHDALGTDGVLTLNLIPRDASDLAARLFALRRVFARRTLCLSVPAHDNVIAIGFRRAPELHDLTAQAAAAARQWGLEFHAFRERLQRENPLGSGIF